MDLEDLLLAAYLNVGIFGIEEETVDTTSK
jgi:hypothetical protein